jgi:hypothetical protein
MVVGDRLGDVLQEHRLADRGGATISARWPLPCGAMMSITRADLSFWVGSVLSSVSFCSG